MIIERTTIAPKCATCETPATDLNPLYKMRKGKRWKLFCGMCASEAEQNGWKHTP